MFLGYSTFCRAKCLIRLHVLTTAWTTAVPIWDLQAGMKGAVNPILGSQGKCLVQWFPCTLVSLDRQSPLPFLVTSASLKMELSLPELLLGRFPLTIPPIPKDYSSCFHFCFWIISFQWGILVQKRGANVLTTTWLSIPQTDQWQAPLLYCALAHGWMNEQKHAKHCYSW